MAIRVIDDTKLNDIAVAIQQKSGMAEQMTVDEMPQRIADIKTGSTIDENASLILMDWEGTVLKSYSKEEAMALTDLPENSGVEHDMLLFQSWNFNINKIKEILTKHPDRQLIVGAIYTTTDGEDHYYFNNPRLTDKTSISVIKKGHIDSSSFVNHYSLTNINIPDGTTSIGANAFNGCGSLKTINIPDGVTSIGSTAFGYCNSLTNVNISDSVTKIEGNVFGSCSSLKTINIPEGVAEIYANTFFGCSSLETVNIPKEATSIANGIFNGCKSLKNVNIPDSVTKIENNAFCNCSSLKIINIPDGVKTIGSTAFGYCNSLTNVSIPKGVISIGDAAFGSCKKLHDVILRGKPEISGTSCFFGSSYLRFYAHQSNLEWYSTATNWSTLYEQDKIVTIEDNIDYLVSLGYGRDELLEVSE